MRLERLIEQLDWYYEHAGLEIWAEPRNALINLGFLLPAFAMGHYLMTTEARTGSRDQQAAPYSDTAILSGLGATAGKYVSFRVEGNRRRTAPNARAI